MYKEGKANNKYQFNKIFPLLIDIVPSFNAVQYQGKLMIQTWENDEKPNFTPKFGPKNFFCEFYLY